MKKQNILILSLAAVAGMALAGCSLAPSASLDEDSPAASIIEDEVETADEVGTKVALHNAAAPTAKVNMSSAFGYQIIGRTDSTMSVRIIAVVDDYKNLASASVTSKVVSARADKGVAGDDEKVIKAEKTFPVSEVYSSLADSSNVSWNGAVEDSFAKKYYIVYTLKNVPAANFFDTIIVKFSATSLSEESKEIIVNAYGVAGWDSRLKATKIDGTDSDYSLTATFDANADLNIPSSYYSVIDCYASKLGTITTIGASAFSKSVNKLALPNTITTIKAGAFSYVNVAEMNIPSSLVSIASGAFKGSYKVTKLVYEAANLVNANDTGFYAANIVVSKNVQSIPDKFFASSNKPESITFEGTESQWEAMKKESNASSGFYYLDAVCADTTYSTVTFHYGEGKLGEATGEVAVTARNNRAIANPGSPTLSGKEFKGWFKSEEGTEAFDFASLITADLDLYAIYGEPGPGYSFANPLEVSPGHANSFSASLYPGKEFEYIKFTVPESAESEGDWYYFYVDEDSSSKDSSTSTCTSGVDGDITVYDSAQSAIALDEGWSIKNTGVAQYQSSSEKGAVRLFAKPGETYYLKASITRAYYSNMGQYNYGTIAMKFLTFDNDSVTEAIAMSKDVALTPNIVDTDQHLLYKFVASSSETLLFSKEDTHSVYTSITAVDAASPSTAIVSKGGTGAYSFGLDVAAGHTYYIELSQNYVSSAEKPVSLKISDAPSGYSKDKALSYSLGDTQTVSQIYTSANNCQSGAYYSFAVSESGLYGVTTSVGSSSYRQSVVLYDASGATVSGGALNSDSGKALTASEVTLEAGSYTAFVGYDSSSSISSWKDFTFRIYKIAEGDSINLPSTITPTLNADMALAGSVSGRFYKFAATADNFLILDVSKVSSGSSVALLDTAGKSLKTAKNGKIVYKTEKGTSYIVKVSGADAQETVTFSRKDSVETGESAETAYSLSLGSDGLFDLTGYASSTSSSVIYFKYTAPSTATYKLFFQATKDGEAATGNGPDSQIDAVYGSSASGAGALTAIVNKDDDKGAHPETLGVAYSGYAEYAFAAGTTYYLKLKVPALSSSADALKFGVKEKTIGSSSDVPATGASINASSTSLSIDGTSEGYWTKVTFAEAKQFSFTLPNEATTILIYQASDVSSPVATLSGTSASEKMIFEAGDYLFYCQVGEASEKTSVNVTVAQSELPDFYITTSSGTGTYSDRKSIPSGGASKGWAEMSDQPGVYKSGNGGTNYGKSALTYHFTKAGTFSFEWTFSGENNCSYDYLYVTHTSGTSTSVLVDGSKEGDSSVASFDKLAWHKKDSVAVEAGDTITFLYTKDSGSNGSLDAAYIRNVAFTAE